MTRLSGRGETMTVLSVIPALDLYVIPRLDRGISFPQKIVGAM